MKPLVLLAIGLGATSVYAQPLHGGEPDADRLSGREQRRIELRTALQASRQVDTPSPRPVEAQPVQKSVDAVPPARHLSPHELAEMREQLRRQQRGAQTFRP